MEIEDTNTVTPPNPDDNKIPDAAALRNTITAEVKAEFDAKEQAAQELFADELKNAPDHLKALIPEALPLIEQVKWLRKARESGASFSTAVPATDSRRPSNTTPAVDTASLSPVQRIAAGYKTK